MAFLTSHHSSSDKNEVLCAHKKHLTFLSSQEVISSYLVERRCFVPNGATSSFSDSDHIDITTTCIKSTGARSRSWFRHWLMWQVVVRRERMVMIRSCHCWLCWIVLQSCGGRVLQVMNFLTLHNKE